MSKAKKKNVESGTPYDDAFHTMLSDCSELLIPVINEIFGKSYTGEEEIRFHQNEHYMNQQDGNLEKRVTDQSFTIISKTGEEDKYLFECQSLPDSSMLIRVFEYVTQIALDDGKIVGTTLEVTIPMPAVLFLRSNSNTPDKMQILIHI